MGTHLPGLDVIAVDCNCWGVYGREGMSPIGMCCRLEWGCWMEEEGAKEWGAKDWGHTSFGGMSPMGGMSLMEGMFLIDGMFG